MKFVIDNLDGVITVLRPSKELLTEPGIRYLEYYGMRYIRAYSYLRIGMAVMSGIFFSVAMVTFSLHVMDDFIPFYYVMSGMGVIFFLLAIIFVLFFPDRRSFKKIVELRDKNAVTELKEILSKPGVKSTLAMLALIDLGEVEPEAFYRMNRGRDQQSLGGL
ncbi:MAG: hypothetical protein ACTSQK_07495 [Candidatus Heimdallarchaeota archaeon]